MLLGTKPEKKNVYCFVTWKIEIKDEKIALKCKACAHEFEPENLNYGICPKCQSTNLDIIRGNEMLLLSLELKEG